MTKETHLLNVNAFFCLVFEIEDENQYMCNVESIQHLILQKYYMYLGLGDIDLDLCLSLSLLGDLLLGDLDLLL